MTTSQKWTISVCVSAEREVSDWAEVCTFAASLSFSPLRMVDISGFILGPEELEIWVWTGLSSQKGHELKQEYSSNFDHALTFDSQEVLLGQFPDFRTGISLHCKAKSKQVAISLSH